ncbi:MAG: TonB-dependent receptor [Bryobacterales bacterium]|nr:TonB-dependent receptor [Bryobacterales bacterium]
MSMFVMRLALILLLSVAPLVSQDINGAISGTVTDSSGAVVPNASVTVVNTATSVVAYRGSTNESGNYSAPSLPVGTYRVSVEVAGFKKAEIQGVTLQVDQRARVNVVLQPGELAETVTVVGEGLGQLESESSSLGAIINTTQVKDLPMPSRNVLNLLTLVGGVSSGGAATGINASQLSMNGSRTLNSEFAVDGVSVVSGSTGGVQRVPSTEAVREFRVLTSGYTAEYGRTSGGFVSIVTDSGTNDMHGSLYEYFRNEKLNANDYFRNLRGQNRPVDRYNQFGGKLGGPVYLPKLYNGRDRTFFFFNYEGLRRQVPFNNLSTVAPQAFRAGDFSASPIPVNDPGTNTPFAGNRVPQSRLDPAAMKVMSLLPTPNSPGTEDRANGRTINNYLNAGSTGVVDNQYTFRGDHSVGAKARIWGRLSMYKVTSPSSQVLPGPLDSRVGDSLTSGYQASSSWTHIWSPSVITEAWLGFQRNNPAIDPPSLGINVRDVLGIQRSSYAATPVMNISGWAGMGINSNTYRRQIDNNYQGSASLTWTRGNHTVKTGFQLRKNQFNVFNPGGNFAGIYNFNGQLSSPQRAAGNPIHAMSDFLLGLVKTANYDLPQPMTGRRNANLGVFVQDDWKFSRRLTLNLGVRYELETPMTMSNNIYSRVDPVSGKLLAANKNATRSLNLEAAKFNLAPRIGFAYSLNDKTVLRSAFGAFYSQIFSNMGGVVLYPGFTVAQQFPDLGVGIAQPFKLNEGHPLIAVQDLNDPFIVERAASINNPLAASAQFGEINPMPKSIQWNFGVQHEVARGTIVDVSYVGTRGLNLPLNFAQNPIPFDRGDELARLATAADQQRARRFPTVNNLGSFVHAGTSSYHSLQLKAVRQFTRTLGWQATYTWSKSMDDGSGLFPFSQPYGLDGGQFPFFFRYLDRSISSFDRPHNFAASLQYRTKGPIWMRDFTVSPILLWRTGLPDTITQNNLWPGINQQRPHTVGTNGSGKSGGFAPEGTAVRYLLPTNAANFPFAPSGPFYTGSGAARTRVLPAVVGTLGRNTTREPNEFNIDLAVARTFPLKERLRLEVRAEAFNFLNHTNFNGPDTSLSVQADARTGQAIFNSPGFGLITSAKSARFMQLVLRLEF